LQQKKACDVALNFLRMCRSLHAPRVVAPPRAAAAPHRARARATVAPHRSPPAARAAAMSSNAYMQASCMPLVQNLLLLDSEGKRICVKYFGETMQVDATRRGVARLGAELLGSACVRGRADPGLVCLTKRCSAAAAALAGIPLRRRRRSRRRSSTRRRA
jgi:hypothetical protein